MIKFLMLLSLSLSFSYLPATDLYFLPKSHQIYPKLEYLFRKKGYSSFNSTKMLEVGFSIIASPLTNGIYVAKHRNMKGFVFKFFNNASDKIPEEQAFKQRIRGANAIREAIQSKRIESLFKVPKKWLYRVPGMKKSHYILVAEDMQILSKTKNIKAWKSNKVTDRLLDELYVLLCELGLHDSIYIDNIPFSRDGKVSFVDTEHYGHWPVRCKLLNKVLSDHMRQRWILLQANCLSF